MRELASNLRRFLRILRIGGRHLLAEWWQRRRRRADPRRPAIGGPERLRTALEELGGTFIKLGQMLALQPDILDLEYCNALFKLLDRVEPFPYAEVERIVGEDLGRRPDEIFDSFETASFAAASIGQVHRATLGGRLLAVKVRRPTVEVDFAGDIRLMVAAIRLIRVLRLRPLDWLVEPLSEFVAWTREELDYRNEASYMERLRANAVDNPKERIPAVLWDLTSSRVLVVDFLAGLPVIDYVRALETGGELTQRRLDAAGFDADAFARAIVDNFLGDAFRHGLFHADLHPANLLILPDDVVGYVDFGITGALSTYSRRHLIAMTLAYTQGDLQGMAASFFRVSAIDRHSDPEAFHAGLARLADGWYEWRGRQRRLRKNFTLVMLDMLRLSRATGIWPERDVIKYIRSAIAIDGLIGRFAPGFDVGSYLEQVCARQLGQKRLDEAFGADRLLDGALSSSRLAFDGALRGNRLIDRLLAGELPLRAELAEVGERTAPGGGRVAVQAVVLIGAALLLRFGGEPAAVGWNAFTAQLLLVATTTVVLVRGLQTRTA